MKAQDPSLRQYLADVLRPMGLENVIRFVVGLLPGAGRDLCSLFVIKQQKVTVANKHVHQSVYHYELELLQECTDDSVRSFMVDALLNAPGL